MIEGHVKGLVQIFSDFSGSINQIELEIYKKKWKNLQTNVNVDGRIMS